MVAATIETGPKRARFRMPGSSLTHRIAAVLFLSLLAIEGIIFVPSYLHKERELLTQVELRARDALHGIVSGKNANLAGEIEERREGLTTETPIRGAVVYDASDVVVAVMGEPIRIQPSKALAQKQRPFVRTADGKRFDVVWTAGQLRAPFRIAARLDSSDVNAELANFIFELAGLFLIVAVGVTAVLTIVLKRVVVRPVLAVHEAILNAGKDVSKAGDWTIATRTEGEIGELILAVNHILQHVSHNFRLVQIRNNALMAEARSRRRAQDEARLAHLRLTEAVEAFPGGFAVFDADDRLTLFNHTFRDFFPGAGDALEPGILFEKLLRAGVAADQGRGDYRRDEDWIKERLAQHRSGSADMERQLSSGRWIRITERHTEEGGVLGIFMDISDLKQREGALRTSEAKFRSVAESANDALIVTTADGDVVFWNGAAEKLTGYAADEIINQPMARIIPPERLETYEARCDLFRSAHEGEAAGEILESEICAKSGERIYVETSFSVYSDRGVRYVTRSMRDMRLRRKGQAERQQLQAQLFQSQKNEALGTLAGGIAHDFNNLLAIILGNAKLLEGDIEPGAPGRDELDAITSAGDRAKNMVKQILSFAREDPGRFEPVDLSAVTDETLTLLRATLPKSIAINSQLSEAVSVWGDSTQMHQIVINLCVNARDAIGDEPGQITVELGEAPAPKDWPITVFDSPSLEHPEQQVVFRSEGSRNSMWMGIPPEGTHIRLGVTDSGSGIDRATLERIFDPFFTTKDIGKGTGLGLAAIQGIVCVHGGALFVESTPDKGTRFEIYLPKNTAPIPRQSNPLSVKDRTGGRILIIDDEPQIVAMMRKSLERKGYEVDGIADPTAALEAIKQTPDRWNVVITDINMPDISGMEIARATQSIRPGLPVLLCTGSLDVISEADRSGHQGQAIISKPVQDAELDRVIQSLLQKNSVRGEG